MDVIWGGLGCNNSISVASDIGSGKVAATTTTTTGGVADALIRLGSSYWNPGVPEVFHKNYMMTINFLGRLESCLIRCANLSSSSASSTSASNASTETAALYKSKIQLFRGHPLYTEFLKKWQVATYFQIRMRDLVAYATNHPPEVAGAGVATGFSTESASSTDSNTDSSITSKSYSISFVCQNLTIIDISYISLSRTRKNQSAH